jgi:hypothetical protein
LWEEGERKEEEGGWEGEESGGRAEFALEFVERHDMI